MRIGVTGAAGQLGRELIRRGCVAIDADVTDGNALRQALAEVEPHVIVHCAAITDVDGCEWTPEEAARVNTGGTYNVALCFNGPIVYISTDYVFAGVLGPYNEFALPNPINIYGWSKHGGELVLQARRDLDDLIVRTTVLYSYDSTNFVTKVLTKLQAGNKVQLPERMWGSPTYVPHLVEAILAAIRRGESGVLNLAGMNVISRYQFGQWIADEWGLDKDLIVPGLITGRASRPMRAGLKVKWAMQLGLPIYSTQQGLAEMRHAMEAMATGPTNHD